MIYAIGLPGARPRMFHECKTEAEAELQLQPGEVFVAIEEKGDVEIAQDGQSAAPRVKPLAELKEERWQAVKRRRVQAIEAGCAVPNIGTFQTDAESLDNVTQAVAGALLAGATAQPFTVAWTLADNSVVVLDGPAMMLAGKLVGERKAACHVHSQVLRAAIEAAVNTAELDAIDIDAGWPA